MSFNNEEYIIELSEKLSELDKHRLLLLFSEVSERSYRRGVQQALTLMDSNAIDEWIKEDNGYSFRYEKSNRTSIGLDGYTRDSCACILANEPYLHFLQT